METDTAASTLAEASWQARKPHSEYTVKTAKLDTFDSDRTLRAPVTIKIDVEDHEAAVLRGAAETIRKYRPSIVCEILARPVRPDGRPGTEGIPRAEQHENAETLAVLADLGYAAFAITADGYFRMTPKDFQGPRTFRDFLLLPAAELDRDRHYYRDLPKRF